MQADNPNAAFEEFFAGLPEYRHTHVSTEDGSPAMLVDAATFTLMNEDGFQWADDSEYWEEID